MKLTIVFPLMNQFPLARTAIQHAVDSLSEDSDVELLVIDNGSDSVFDMGWLITEKNLSWLVIRNEKTAGVYPLFWQALKHANGDIVAVFHSDLMIAEKDWDKRVVEEFQQRPQLGMLGFIGSDEIDGSGGRGLGTTSNFQGKRYHGNDPVGEPLFGWTGSAAAIHGKVGAGFSNAAVVDGCAMIFRKNVLAQIEQRESFPPHHFYDRLLSCEVREKGFTVGVLGVACDHISGQTVAHEQKYHDFAQDWCNNHGITTPDGPDSGLYREAERQWLREYRDTKHQVPCKV